VSFSTSLGGAPIDAGELLDDVGLCAMLASSMIEE
jgi:hypothetical protein